MKVLPLEQGSAEWLAFRKTKITATDIATIMCGNEQEIYDLYLEKVEGKEKHINRAMAEGMAMEQEAIDWFFGKKKKIDRPCVLHDKENQWLMASLDAYHEPTQALVEIKCPQTVPDRVDQYHRYKRAWYQIQTQLYIADHLKEATLLLYSPLVQVKVKIQTDLEAIEEILRKGKEFWERIEKKDPPPKPVGPLSREDEEAAKWAKEFREIDEKLKKLQEERESLREKGIELADGTPFRCEGIEVALTKGRETIDYKEAVKTLCPGADLKSFAKRSEPTWRVGAI